MEPKNKICCNCENLQLTLIEKEAEIKELKQNIKKLLEFLRLYEPNIEGKLNHEIKCIFEGFQKFDEDGYLSNDVKPIQNTGQAEHEATQCKLESDYVYDENYQMYYNLSTGYYYDEKSGYMYEPQSCTYYKYNYEKKEYEKVSNELYTNTELQSNDVCEAVVQHVNNLNLNDDSYPESKTCEPENASVEAPVFTHTGLKNEEENFDVSKSEASINENVCHNSVKDWIPEEGSKMTVTDMVRQVVDEHNNISDYVYDESYQMYYSSSTGYYYDAKRNLLYDPSTGTYYLYDSEKQTYEFHSQVDYSTAHTEKQDENICVVNKERLKSRKLYWKKKLEQSNQCLEELKTDESNDVKDPANLDEDFSSPEDGEIFSSDDESSPPFCITRSPVKASSPTNSDDLCPPCIRAIVENSENLKIGSLILITCSGGIIGRDKTSGICLPDVCVSKVHAEVKYSNELKKYSITDLGSQNGTFINDLRLSEPKEKSEDCTLNHGDKLSLGSCKLLLHIHEGLETCDNCEPGQVLAEISSQKEKNTVLITKEEKEKLRREEVRRLKKKYGLQGANFEKKTNTVPPGYEDKAEMRRQTVGSDCPYEKTEEASIDSYMMESNKGYQMLKKMGWKEGQSLGTAESGMLEPIPLRPWTSKAGLGSSSGSSILKSSSEDKRTKKWVKAQERYFQLSTGSCG